MATSLVPQSSSMSIRKQLSSVSENVVCRLFYEFIFVGSSAVDVIERILESDLHEAMTELAEKAGERESMRTASLAAKKVNKERRKVYVKVTEDNSELAKIGCNPLVSFEDTVPELKDDAAVRTNLFVFIYDTRPNEPDFRPMEVLNVMFAQMQFQYRNLMRRNEKPPALRALVLRNSGVSMTEQEEQALLEFEEKLKEFTAHGPMKQLEWSVDLQEPDEIYDFVEGAAQVMARPAIMHDRSATTQWDKVDNDKTKSKSKSCCVL